MHTISRLAKQFGLSRSTLVHYDTIGLLRPAGRSTSNYRLYDQVDVKRLERIVAMREAGLSLETIKELLQTEQPDQVVEALEFQLQQLHEQMGVLRRQQEKTARLLAHYGGNLVEKVMNKAQWVALMRSAGMSDEDMMTWHRAFEASSTTAHRHFLFSLGLEEAEVTMIQDQSKAL
ncbi:MerR family transcriptional regulator [Magnetococcus sp. PR-3]|uniref:MerR family transcriptional regulator n=1 Tax=Magnetococcus sp. PR-3 TaxID=3120355 RepID=UPI002FCE67A4